MDSYGGIGEGKEYEVSVVNWGKLVRPAGILLPLGVGRALLT